MSSHEDRWMKAFKRIKDYDSGCIFENVEFELLKSLKHLLSGKDSQYHHLFFSSRGNTVLRGSDSDYVIIHKKLGIRDETHADEYILFSIESWRFRSKRNCNIMTFWKRNEEKKRTERRSNGTGKLCVICFVCRWSDRIRWFKIKYHVEVSRGASSWIICWSDWLDDLIRFRHYPSHLFLDNPVHGDPLESQNISKMMVTLRWIVSRTNRYRRRKRNA